MYKRFIKQHLVNKVEIFRPKVCLILIVSVDYNNPGHKSFVWHKVRIALNSLGWMILYCMWFGFIKLYVSWDCGQTRFYLCVETDDWQSPRWRNNLILILTFFPLYRILFQIHSLKTNLWRKCLLHSYKEDKTFCTEGSFSKNRFFRSWKIKCCFWML